MSKDLRSVPSTGETFRESVMRLQRMQARTTRERLCALIASGGRVVRAPRLPGGLQCGTHAVDLVTAGGELMRLVFRRYTPQQAAGMLESPSASGRRRS